MGCLQRGLWPPAALTGGGALTPQAGPPVWPRLACVGLEARKAKQQAASALRNSQREERCPQSLRGQSTAHTAPVGGLGVSNNTASD